MDGLRVEYGSFVAVQGLSFSVRAGEVFGLLGTNGAGKTSTMDVLEGYRRPSAGSVRVFGVDPASEREKVAPRVGIMLQEAGFFDDLTVVESIRAWRRFTADAMTVDEAVELVDLGKVAGTRVGKLSGGERRRLDLALAVLGRPELLFLDEPTTGLDPQARRRTWHVLENMVAGGMAILLTTHYMEEAQYLANRVAIMDRGRIMRHGSVDEVIGADHGSTVTFVSEVAVPVELAGVSEDGRHYELTSQDPQADLHRLLDWAYRAGTRLSDLEVRRNSLEDVFLKVADEAALATSAKER
ncbi:ABC transporter ATP-binding protein [Amycolatopsis rhabdoformis]|uniref:ABC transporter ATP-binding protein n=1 Tax=Amycolatopsis rhabdoformis TaxID=1448059 RepID=A0ABZ1I2Q0_9PSEU|nr:ABC transporter ATP-binding protein [Amycolatopsis rhabdoformis]WSE28449.1 ABC transporter ATP-binding protein [Amycolatopsis rhabdoformis]